MRHTKIWNTIACVLLTLGTSSSLWAQDPGWPRQIVRPGGTLIIYQPQVDDWQGFTDLKWREAYQLTPTGGKPVVGAATFEGTTQVDTSTHMVFIYNLRILKTYFPSQDPATSARLDQLIRTFLPPTVNISLDRVLAYLPTPQSVKTVPLKNDPPFVFVSYSPAILLGVDGNPVLSDVPDTNLKFVVNTQWPVFLNKSDSQYYLLVNNIWFSAGKLDGPWYRITKLPKEFNKMPATGPFADVRKMVPPPQPGNPIVPRVFYSTVPSDVILFDGRPTYTAIPGTQLVYANNTDSPVFVYGPTQTYYYLTAGRWFSAQDLAGPWTFATPNLPSDFANIPLSSPASAILASVPGTSEAKDAVLIAQIPTTMVLNPTTAAAQAKVSYTGNPQFVPIEGTGLQYATNTPDKVIQVGDVYYLCLQGVWFLSSTPQGPWTTASSIPQVIYTIPPSSPVYNVTYVTQTTTSSGDVQSSYTAGYLGAFALGAATGAIIASGTGYYYPPYIGYPVGGYPIYRPYPTPYGAYGAYGSSAYYNNRTGAYGVSQTAYGAYGSATRTASYNPYTGTAARTASVSTPYGKQGVGQAYNPYTGAYGATHQGSSPTAQWGQSYVSQGNKSAYTQHYSTANGTVASAQGSQGGKAYGTSTAYGNTAAGKSSSGDMYAGHDGNVYKNTGSGWQKYDNGSWNSVNTAQNQQKAQQSAQSYQQQHPNSQAQSQQYKQSASQYHPSSSSSMQSGSQYHPSSSSSMQSLDSDRQNRMSGSAQSQRFESGAHSEGGFGGGGRSWGGRRGR